MITSDIIIKILEDNNVKEVFGIPGSQILPLYDSLSKSKIKHILTRHEQGAIHASDGYARSSGKFGVCISTAGPGAMNLVMGVATAFKDSIPLLIITGDNDYPVNPKNFQSIPVSNVFESISLMSFHPKNGKEAIENLKTSIEVLKNKSNGPIHINIAKNVLLENISPSFKEEDCKINVETDDKEIKNIISKIEKSSKPLILCGGGVIWNNCHNDLKNFIKKNNIPLVTTFHGKGCISEYEELNLGILGIRGSDISKYAVENADLILSLGCKLSERTIENGIDLKEFYQKLISVNTCENHLTKNSLNMNIKSFLNKIEGYDFKKDDTWLNEIYSNASDSLVVEGIDDSSLPLRPPFIINKILKNKGDNIIVSDAGSHTTWTFLLAKNSNPSQLLFSGGFGPMGYGVPASIGVAIAKPDKKVFVINGDGDFQMNLQELATIKENNLNICIFILNNSQLGIIKQWEKLNNMSPYQVDLNSNPDFKSLGESYNIKSFKVGTEEELEEVLGIIDKLDEPIIVDILTREEDIPLPSKLF